MGRDINEAGGRRQGKRKYSGAAPEGTGIYTYHPTVADKAELAGGAFDLEWAMDVLASKIDQGCGVTMGRREGTDNVYVLIREPHAIWNQAKAVSCWHSEINRALIGLAYYLSKVNQEWPEHVSTSTQPKFDW